MALMKRFHKREKMTKRFKRVLYDIEGDNLYQDVTTIWCAVVVDLPTGETRGFKPDELGSFLDLMEGAELIAGHNIIDFDNPVLDKLHQVILPESISVDTLVWSRLFYPDRPGGHSLGSWGERLGCKKGDFHDFSKFSEEMYTYCLQDGLVNYKLLQYFMKNLGWSWDDLYNWRKSG
jgi:hypothetical protein